jgi:hypothetical protein
LRLPFRHVRGADRLNVRRAGIDEMPAQNRL